MSAALRLDQYSGSDALVLRPVGELNLDTYAQLRDTLLRCAMQEPAAMVVDLNSLRARSTALLTVFPAVWSRIREWPGVPMVLAVDRQPLCRLLERSTVARFVPTYPNVTEALTALRQPSSCRRRELRLNGEPDCAREVRRGVEQACHEWGVSEVTTNALLVACELAENLVRHARSEGWLRLQLRGGLLTIAVADTNPNPPRLRPPHERRDGGRGMVLVDELSRSWGYTPQAGGGKVVWAALRVSGW